MMPGLFEKKNLRDEDQWSEEITIKIVLHMRKETKTQWLCLITIYETFWQKIIISLNVIAPKNFEQIRGD